MSIRVRLLLGCLTMMCVTVALGLHARHQANLLGQIAIDGYEKSLLSISYARSTQLIFVHAMTAGRSKSGPADTQGAISRLHEAQGDLEVALERIPSPDTKALARALRDELASVARSGTLDGVDVDGIGQKFDDLVTTLLRS